MKITKQQLKRIIKEELEMVLGEAWDFPAEERDADDDFAHHELMNDPEFQAKTDDASDEQVNLKTILQLGPEDVAAVEKFNNSHQIGGRTMDLHDLNPRQLTFYLLGKVKDTNGWEDMQPFRSKEQLGLDDEQVGDIVNILRGVRGLQDELDFFEDMMGTSYR